MADVAADVKRSYRSPVRAAAAEDTRRRIREAATELFVARGYPGTTLREVADRAGVGERTLYDSFGGKYQLLRHTLDFLTMGDDDRLPAAARPGPVAARALEDPREVIAAHCAIGAALLERAGDLILVAEAAAAADPEVRATYRRRVDATYDVHLRLAQRLADRGELRAGLTVEQAADIQITIGSPAVFHSFRRRYGWTAERYREWMTETFVQQLLTTG